MRAVVLASLVAVPSSPSFGQSRTIGGEGSLAPEFRRGGVPAPFISGEQSRQPAGAALPQSSNDAAEALGLSPAARMLIRVERAVASLKGGHADLSALETYADAGDPIAAYELGRILADQGRPDTATKAFRYLLRAAQAGRSDAQFRMAQMLSAGNGAAQNRDLAREWLTVAARGGHPGARQLAREWHLDWRQAGPGIDQMEQMGRDERAYQAWHEFALTGSPIAMLQVGVRRSTGTGVQADNADGMRWIARAAAAHYAPAMHIIGLTYHSGEGVPRNSGEAAIWLHLAAMKAEDPDQKRKIASDLEKIRSGLPPAQVQALNALLSDAPLPRESRPNMLTLEQAQASEFFSFFALKQAGRERVSSSGEVTRTFRPQGERFRKLAAVELSTGQEGHISSAQLILARSFIDDPQVSSMARDIAKSFLFFAAPRAQDALKPIADELQFRDLKAPLLMRSDPPRLPAEPSPVFRTFMGEPSESRVSVAGAEITFRNRGSGEESELFIKADLGGASPALSASPTGGTPSRTSQGLGSGQAMNEKQRNVVGHIAELRVNKEFCPSLEINESFVRGASGMFGVNVAASPFREELESRMERLRSEVNSLKLSSAEKSRRMCVVAQEFYGPKGTKVPHMLKGPEP